MRYYLAVRDSDIFAVGECGGKYATYKSSRLMRTQCAHVPKAHIARRHIAREQHEAHIANPARDLYRFSLSALSDKLNFPREMFWETNSRE